MVSEVEKVALLTTTPAPKDKNERQELEDIVGNKLRNSLSLHHGLIRHKELEIHRMYIPKFR